MKTTSGENKKFQFSRRQFVSKIITVSGASALLILPAKSKAGSLKTNEISIQDIIDAFINTVPGAPLNATVDTIKTGDPLQKVSGIVTTMFATIEVIKKAISLNANFIIAHEPSYYNHLDETNWLKDDEVYKYKTDLLNKYNIVIWRCHDYIHTHVPDGVLIGVLTAMKWDKYYDASNPNVVTIPETSFENIIQLSKTSLNIEHLKIVGNTSQPCKRIVIMPGAAGGVEQITSIQKNQPDLLIVGEINEWETSEYTRDLQLMGGKTSLLVLGHIVSEEPGMQWMLEWLNGQFPAIKTTHIPSRDAFSWA